MPLSDADIRDALPEDLDAAGYVGPYMFPNNNRRRIPAYLYWGISAITIAVWVVRQRRAGRCWSTPACWSRPSCWR